MRPACTGFPAAGLGLNEKDRGKYRELQPEGGLKEMPPYTPLFVMNELIVLLLWLK